MRSPSSRSGWRRSRQIGTAVGLLLLGLAILAVARQTDWAELRQALAAADPAWFARLALAVVANLLATGVLFNILFRRYGQVGWGEMQAVIAGAALVNYLPLRPGLVGRAVYHHRVNGIPFAAVLRVSLEALALSALVAAYAVGAAYLVARFELPLIPTVLAPVPLLGLAMVPRASRRWSAAALSRFVDLMLWAVRYHASFALIGAPISATTALVLACISMAAMAVPFVSNGLGVREWAIGLLAPLLGGAPMTQALSAELLNRLAEVIVIVVLGAPALLWVSRRLVRAMQVEEGPPPA